MILKYREGVMEVSHAPTGCMLIKSRSVSKNDKRVS
jgi:hypothetical protein